MAYRIVIEFNDKFELNDALKGYNIVLENAVKKIGIAGIKQAILTDDSIFYPIASFEQGSKFDEQVDSFYKKKQAERDAQEKALRDSLSNALGTKEVEETDAIN